jgi:hypothetical protein
MSHVFSSAPAIPAPDRPLRHVPAGDALRWITQVAVVVATGDWIGLGAGLESRLRPEARAMLAPVVHGASARFRAAYPDTPDGGVRLGLQVEAIGRDLGFPAVLSAASATRAPSHAELVRMAAVLDTVAALVAS